MNFFQRPFMGLACLLGGCVALSLAQAEKPGANTAAKAQAVASKVYPNTLARIAKPQPLLADFPEFIDPVADLDRFESPLLIDDDSADLSVRGWRWSYNARGIIEVPNRLRAAKTAIVVVHPWGIDDGQGWRTPEPNGVAFHCTVPKNQRILKHVEVVVQPFIARLRPHVGAVIYSLPGTADPIRRKLYRTVHGTPTNTERREAAVALADKLASFEYRGQALPAELTLTGKPAIDYFRQFPGLDASDRYDGPGFWKLPIPVTKPLQVQPNDVVIFDGEGYDVLKRFLAAQGIEHVLLCGYSTDMCVCSTAAGYENLRRDFNTFLVGDATQATHPANATSQHATNQAVSFASLNLFITQVSWVKLNR